MNLKALMYIYIALILATEGILQGLKISGIDISRVLQVAVFIFLIKSFYFDINNNKALRTIFYFFIVMLLFLSLKMFVTTFYFNDLDMDIFFDAIRLILMMVSLYLTYYIIKKDMKYLNLILIFNLPIMLVAFFQFQMFPFSDIAWDIKFDYFNYQRVTFHGEGTLETNNSFRQRVIGLYATSIPLSYILVTNMIIGLYLYLKTNSKIYLLYFLFLGITSFFTLTRSVVLAFFILLIYVGYIGLVKSSLKKKIYTIIIITVLSFASLFLLGESEGKLDRLSSSEGKSATGRLPLAITGAVALIKYPFGITDAKYDEVKKEMYQVLRHPNVLKFTSHNGLLNVGFTYTVFGLLYFIYFIFKMKKVLKQYLSPKMMQFFIVGTFAYFAHGLFHNNFIFVVEFYILIVLAIIANEYRIEREKYE